MNFFTKYFLYTLSLFLVSLMTIGSGRDNLSVRTHETSETNTVMSDSLTPGNAEQGKPLFVQNCSACHGQDGLGIKGLGKDLVHSEFVDTLTNAELLQYVKKGRAVDDPLNTTGIPMPPKGGNPALTDQQIMNIIAYMREMQKEADKSEK